jgi:predicted nucleotidyltransferase
MATLLDFSQKAELGFLSELAVAVAAAAEGASFMVAGATARDLLLFHAHGIDTERQTKDVDLALLVETWDQYLALRQRLLASGQFSSPAPALHKFRFRTALEVDLIPFGGVERSDRTIEWPPDGSFVMVTFGFQEALRASVRVRLPGNVEISVPSLSALAMLKLLAWTARRYTEPAKDAPDFRLILRKYLDTGNQDRLYGEAMHLVMAEDFDYEVAGAWLLGTDMSRLLDPADREPLARLLAREIDESEAPQLIRDMGLDLARGIRLLRAVHTGFVGAEP